jgi:hypothetical protein
MKIIKDKEFFIIKLICDDKEEYKAWEKVLEDKEKADIYGGD